MDTYISEELNNACRRLEKALGCHVSYGRDIGYYFLIQNFSDSKKAEWAVTNEGYTVSESGSFDNHIICYLD